MDADSDERHEWSTPGGLVGFGGAVTLAAGCWWVLSDALIDRVFIGVLVLLLACACAYAGLLRPRLRADHRGLTVRGLSGSRSWAWDQVRWRVRRHQRFGRTVEVLELDLPELHLPEHDLTDDEPPTHEPTEHEPPANPAPGGLVVLGKLDLGTEPRAVAERLERLRRTSTDH